MPDIPVNAIKSENSYGDLFYNKSKKFIIFSPKNYSRPSSINILFPYSNPRFFLKSLKLQFKY